MAKKTKTIKAPKPTMKKKSKGKTLFGGKGVYCR